MQQQEWRCVDKSLRSTVARLDEDISKAMQALSAAAEQRDRHDCSSEQLAAACRARVAEARTQLADLRKQVLGSNPTSAAVIAALAARVAAFAQSLNDIKAQQRAEYGSLLQEEQALAQELAPLQLLWLGDSERQHTCPARSQPVAGTAHAQPQQQPQPPPSVTTSTADCMRRSSPDRAAKAAGGANYSSGSSSSGTGSGLPPEVQAYDAHLARHGETGGWHPDDHATFLKVLKAHRGDYHAALAVVVEEVPLQSRASVLAHCRWHADLCELDMRRRIAMVSWRAARDAAKAATAAQAAALGDCDDAAQAAAAADADQQARHAAQAKQQQEQLAAWRAQQQAAREAAAASAQEQRRQQQEQERQRLQQRRAQLKGQVEAARAERQQQAQRQAAEAALQEAQARAQSALADPACRQRLQERNAAAVERQRQLLAVRQERVAAKERAAQQLRSSTQALQPRVERDPGRLLSATAAAAARQAAAAEAAVTAAKVAASARAGPAASGFVLHIGGRKAVPSWLAGSGGDGGGS